MRTAPSEEVHSTILDPPLIFIASRSEGERTPACRNPAGSDTAAPALVRGSQAIVEGPINIRPRSHRPAREGCRSMQGTLITFP
jgi:hypothetical protein